MIKNHHTEHKQNTHKASYHLYIKHIWLDLWKPDTFTHFSNSILLNIYTLKCMPQQSFGFIMLNTFGVIAFQSSSTRNIYRILSIGGKITSINKTFVTFEYNTLLPRIVLFWLDATKNVTWWKYLRSWTGIHPVSIKACNIVWKIVLPGHLCSLKKNIMIINFFALTLEMDCLVSFSFCHLSLSQRWKSYEEKLITYDQFNVTWTTAITQHSKIFELLLSRWNT